MVNACSWHPIYPGNTSRRVPNCQVLPIRSDARKRTWFLDEKSNDYKFRGMQWWPFDSADTTEAWKGADHHCSIRDIWAKRPTMRTEDEIAEREAAARVVETTRVRKQQRAAVEGNMYLCTHTGCEREQRGRGFGSIQTLQGHHAWHNRDVAIAEDRHLCTITGCDRAILGHGLATPLALQQHMVFHFKLGNDAYLCTYDQCGRSQAGKGFKTLQTLERHLTRNYQLDSGTSPCAELVTLSHLSRS